MTAVRHDSAWVVDAGAVDALLAAVQGVCRERGRAHVRWVTRAGKERARKVYDRLALQTDLVTYDLGVD